MHAWCGAALARLVLACRAFFCSICSAEVPTKEGRKEARMAWAGLFLALLGRDVHALLGLDVRARWSVHCNVRSAGGLELRLHLRA